MEIEVSTGLDSPVSIEAADWRDLSALRRIERICFTKDAWPLLDLIGILTFPSVLRFKAVAKEQMVGFVGVDLRRSEREAWIATICVLPEYRRRGIAQVLMHACEERIDLPVIKLSARISNHAAIRLYLKFGYQKAEVWKAYYQDGEDAQVMVKRAPVQMRVEDSTAPSKGLMDRISRTIKRIHRRDL